MFPLTIIPVTSLEDPHPRRARLDLTVNVQVYYRHHHVHVRGSGHVLIQGIEMWVRVFVGKEIGSSNLAWTRKLAEKIEMDL